MPRIAHQPAPTAPGPGPSQPARIPIATYPKSATPASKPTPVTARVKISPSPPTLIPTPSPTSSPSPAANWGCSLCARKSCSKSSKHKSKSSRSPDRSSCSSCSSTTSASSASPRTPRASPAVDLDGPAPPKLHPSQHWHDAYPPPLLSPSHQLPKPPPATKMWTTKWKRDNPNLKTREGLKAYYANLGMPMGGMGMYPGVMNPMMGMGGMGMYPGMGMGMGSMMGGYGMSRYGGYGGMYGGMGYPGYGMMDPYVYGPHPSANFVDEFPDAHRIEHAYRQSMPDSYGLGLGAMAGGLAGGMGINNMPGSQVLLYGRGMGYGVGF